MRTTTPMTPRQAPKARFGGRVAYASPEEDRRRLFKIRSVKIGPRQSWTRVAFDQPEQDMIPPSPVYLEEAACVALAPETVAFKQGDRWRVLGDAGCFDPMQPQLGQGEFDCHRYSPRHAPFARIRGAHPVAKRPTLR